VFCCDPVTKWPKHPDDCGGRCARCKERVCFKCKAVGECDPEEEKLRRMERRAMEQAMRDPTVRALRDQVKAEQELKSKIEDQWTRLFK
jgi:hypothetical protein